MWSHNASWGLGGSLGGGSGEGEEEGRDVLVVVGAVLGVLGVVTVVLNLFLLFSILFHPPARSRCFHLHIVNMSVAAVLQGAGVLPLWTHYLIHGVWLYGDLGCRWWLAADTVATSVTALAIVLTAFDRFIYLICWRFVFEGGKYVFCFLFIFLSWLAALTLTLTLTFMDADEARGGGHIGVQGAGGLCSWGPVKGERMVAARLVIYALGAGLGTGLCLALVLLPCLGQGDVLPIDEDEGELAVRRKSLNQEKRRSSSKAAAAAAETELIHRGHAARGSAGGIEVIAGEDEDEDFPRFLLVSKTNRLEERDRWKWQVISLLTVTLAWALLWLPAHLFVFAHKLGVAAEDWRLPQPMTTVTFLAVGYAHTALMPLLWLLHQPIRKAVMALIFCRCCRGGDCCSDDEVFDDSTSVEFQDVGPYYRPAPSSSSAAAQPLQSHP